MTRTAGRRLAVASRARERSQHAFGHALTAMYVWASMGQEEEKKIREAAFAGYQVNKELMAVTNKDCMVLHCLPAHRGEEITADVFEEHANEIFEEAENRLHAQKAVLVECMADEMPEKV